MLAGTAVTGQSVAQTRVAGPATLPLSGNLPCWSFAGASARVVDRECLKPNRTFSSNNHEQGRPFSAIPATHSVTNRNGHVCLVSSVETVGSLRTPAYISNSRYHDLAGQVSRPYPPSPFPRRVRAPDSAPTASDHALPLDIGCRALITTSLYDHISTRPRPPPVMP